MRAIRRSFVVAQSGFEPETQAYEAREIPFLHRASVVANPSTSPTIAVKDFRQKSALSGVIHSGQTSESGCMRGSFTRCEFRGFSGFGLGGG